MNTKKIIIKNTSVCNEEGNLESAYIKINNGLIEEINILDKLQLEDDYKIIDLSDRHTKAVPGMIDVHIHGANGSDVMDGTKEALDNMTSILPKEGTTAFLATTMTQSKENIETALENVAFYMKEQPIGQAEILGIHLEGPFINAKRKGAQPAKFIQSPQIELFKRWNEIANEHIKLVTVAPELENALPFISYLKEKGVIASAGHTDATAKEIEVAIEHGLSHITHLYNQMRGFHHREPGVVGASWLNDQLMVELIADGIHSTPEAIRSAFLQKGSKNITLITDAMRAKCLQDGNYDLGGQKVTVENNKASLEDGTLAGSTLKLEEAFKNIMHFTDCSVEEAIAMTAKNAAKELGVSDRKGSISVGKEADIVIMDKQHDILFTFCHGEIAYRRDS